MESWAGQSEAIVVGDVVVVEPLFEPAAVSGPGREELPSPAECLERGGWLHGGIWVVLD